MRLPFSLYNLLTPEHYTWHQIRILHETDKAILVTALPVIARSEAMKQSQKTWIPKSQILGIRLRKNVFEIYVREGT